MPGLISAGVAIGKSVCVFMLITTAGGGAATGVEKEETGGSNAGLDFALQPVLPAKAPAAEAPPAEAPAAEPPGEETLKTLTAGVSAAEGLGKVRRLSLASHTISVDFSI